MKKLMDKVAVVTGAGGGLGREISLHFAREGAKVIATDINKTELRKTVNIIEAEVTNSVHAIEMDVSDPSSISHTADYVKETFTKVDILVNNAGFLKYNHIFDYELDDWDKLMNVNLRGYFLVTQAFTKMMVENNQGKIINISSVAATNGLPGGTAYAASKGGINSMTKVLATDLAPYNINVNAIAPGPIDGDFLNVNANEESLKKRIDKTLFKRLGTYSDVARPVVFLASSDSDWITGTVLVTDGGFTV
ncbi:hypothetical protein CR194_09115 [Salipaludibacillus keqinensis]|uniref:Short-chain dehydrogenase n=1 Tax=Salipaludibacillus keqinensis TaxID=2045207 RepID=A0A323TD90_9BACI|nr:SDR family oxidoreductase [Salipaludibacillus keqinensis]PYZ93342.1 hypothetical protein CR194_09115 [Salipaludibacillus keqinensis]